MTSHNEDNRPEAILDRVLEKTGTVPASHNEAQKTNEEIVNAFRNLYVEIEEVMERSILDKYVMFLQGVLTLKDEAHKKEMEELVRRVQAVEPESNGRYNACREILDALTPTKEVTEEAHYEERAGMPLWVTYTDGQEVVEPYKHQDGTYAKMCAYPNYCRCTD